MDPVLGRWSGFDKWTFGYPFAQLWYLVSLLTKRIWRPFALEMRWTLAVHLVLGVLVGRFRPHSHTPHVKSRPNTRKKPCLNSPVFLYSFYRSTPVRNTYFASGKALSLSEYICVACE